MEKQAIPDDVIKTSLKKKIAELKKTLPKNGRALICTHDNPDPDSIASALALGALIKSLKKIDFTITYGGVLGRAENREMVKLLKIPLLHFSKIDHKDYCVLGLVDTQPEMGNHVWHQIPLDNKILICIDHHPARKDRSVNADFMDIGGSFGATSSMMTHYLEQAGLIPDEQLATALFYGIKSDTRDLGREASTEDIWAYSHLVKLTNMPLLSSIEHPKLPREYFSVLVRAIQKSQIYNQNIVACDLGAVYIPDLIAETSDRLASAKGIRWSIVLGEYQNSIFVSIRVNDRRFSAGKLAREVITFYPTGSAGGHGSMAGAKIPHSEKCRSNQGKTKARKKLLKRFILQAGGHLLEKPEKFAPRPPFVSNISL